MRAARAWLMARFLPVVTRSHLLTSRISDRPLSCAYPAMVASSALTPSVASINSSAMSASSRCLRDITTESFSAISRVLPLRRMPAVSTKRKCCPSRSTTSSTASRVVPGTGETMARDVPVSWFSSVDFPTLGWPMMATLISAGSGWLDSADCCWLVADGDAVVGRRPPRSARAKNGRWLTFSLGALGGQSALDRQARHQPIQQLIHSPAMLGGHRKHFSDPKAVKLAQQALLLVAVDLVDGKKEGLSGFAQQPRQFQVRSGNFAAAIDHHHDRCRFFQRHPCLAEDFHGDQVFVFGNDAAGVDHAKRSSPPLAVPIEPVARDAGFVADDGPPRAHQPVEQRRLADVRPAHDGKERRARCRIRGNGAVSGIRFDRGQESVCPAGSQSAWGQTPSSAQPGDRPARLPPRHNSPRGCRGEVACACVVSEAIIETPCRPPPSPQLPPVRAHRPARSPCTTSSPPEASSPGPIPLMNSAADSCTWPMPSNRLLPKNGT